PDLHELGNKSNSRKVFRAANIPLPPGFEDLFTEDDLVNALYELKQHNPHLRKAVVKLNEGFSGDGNALFSYDHAPQVEMKEWLRNHLPLQLQPVAQDMKFAQFMKLFEDGGGVAEEFIEGDEKVSPSVQCLINPLGKIEIVSTHDQRLGGSSGQIFLGASFPAQQAYAPAIGEMGRQIAQELRLQGVLGRFAVDFISVKEEDMWRHYAIEINLRKGGTTHPYLMLQFLTNGEYQPAEGVYYAANGQPRYYVSTDNLKNDAYKGLTPHDLIDIAMCNDLLYDGALQEGVIFHLISALSQFGKLGMVCIGSTPERADFFYNKTVDVLNKEGKQ
ncbi:MAG TPA: peptide ligase PGM1-related protein, partial [Flavisolibacter sp.]|nr:peptide ligase PGM1-related protein [Flavisolibacter sp.]